MALFDFLKKRNTMQQKTAPASAMKRQQQECSHVFVPVEGNCGEQCSLCGCEREGNHAYETTPIADDEIYCRKNVCLRCGKEQLLNHEFQRANGRYLYRCSVCGQEKIEEHPHDFFRHKCRGCGMFDDTVTWNGDFVAVPSEYHDGFDLIGYRGYGEKNLVLPEGISYIGTNHFDHLVGNNEIETVRFPSTLKYTGMHTFSGCKNLRKVEMNEGLTHIGQSAFYGCTSLHTVNFPSTLKDISSFAFENCINLSEVELPDGLESIADNAFSRCEKLVIACHAGTQAHRYALRSKIPVVVMPGGDLSALKQEPKIQEATEDRGGRNIRHIVCICYDSPEANLLKPQRQNFIVNAELGRGNKITSDTRITFDSFYDNGDLEKPSMLRQKLEQVYCRVYHQSAMFELADKTIAREAEQKDGHTMVKYFVLYE